MKDPHDYGEYLMFCEMLNREPEAEKQYRLVVVRLFPRGLGDTAKTVFHALGIDRVAEIYTEITGKPCGCGRRQEDLNKIVPYGEP